MDILLFLIVSFAVLLAAYLSVGRLLNRVFKLHDGVSTPAHRLRDGVDYEPIPSSSLLPQHFSAISAAGPIVGPILAAVYFGWGPAWLWILFGSILVGGIHDFSALVASVRHGARSIAEVVRVHMNPRAYALFLIFIWCTLTYVIIAFADVTAGTFVAKASKAGGDAPGPAVVTSSVIYLGLAVVMGFALRFTRIGPTRAKLIFLPLVAAAIVVGPYIPLDLARILPTANVQQIWGFLLLGYCFVAAIAPLWALLQPRGELGGYFLYIVMGLSAVGILVGALTGTVHINPDQPFFKGWNAKDSFGAALPLFPILFVTVACGACSGFHSIVAGGTTSKQLSHERDATPVAYGSMLLEGFLACLSLTTVMILAKADEGRGANWIYANGIAQFATRLLGGGGFDLLFQFALLCFATFVFDTLDACTRLARYILMELLGWKSRRQAILATALSLVVPVIAIAIPRVSLGGKELPLWQVFWGIFGSSNQLMAALTLLGVSVWLARKKMPYLLTLGPMAFMMVMTVWSLYVGAVPYVKLWQSGGRIEMIRHFQFGITVMLIVLAIWLVVEAIITWRDISRPPMATEKEQVDDHKDEPENELVRA